MASIARPALLRQVCNAAPSRRMASTFAGSSLKHPSPLTRRPMQSAFATPGASRVAAFHASGRRPILPPLPQVVDGDVNKPAPVPEPSASHGNYHWTFERLISAGLIPLSIAPFAAGSLNPLMDASLCALIIVHSHIGFTANIIDYFPEKRVPLIRKGSFWLLRAGTVLLGIGMYSFETNDVGITEAIKRVWHA
ncbi:mitochondrial succinate dehydrogenase cytochrome b560 subunit D [Lophium mytilinum]|uniref:Succinate dehydrogenase [ubiquinone] cytochrome b small subunit n=1 Tax=Lophium mytilinum TaxID=390894 RepID=A0A6A6QQ23_9PEZI|nr:mitochondrial succinate dehydrogenase cytochrome b560 subunit D [Lophium mytilinum]